MRALGDSPAVFECASCENLGFGTGHDSGELRCCDAPMEPVGGQSPSNPPTLDDLLRTVFDMSDTELELCLCVMAGGELTVKQLARETDYDRSVVTRHLNHLVDVGALERHRRLLEQGGQVYVYTPRPAESVREAFTREFTLWVAHAVSVLDDLSREKVESIAEDSTNRQWRIFQRTGDS